MKNLMILGFMLVVTVVVCGQTNYEEFRCYIGNNSVQLKKANTAASVSSVTTTTTGTTNLAIVLCVEQGQNRIISINDFVNVLKDKIPDYYDKTTNGYYDVNVIDVLVDSTDTANDRAFAYELPGTLVAYPPTDTNFVAAPWMVRNVLAKADLDYNFANYDSNNDGVVDYLAFLVIRFGSGWSNGTPGLSIDSYYSTNDNFSGGGKIKIDGNGYLSLAGKRAIIQRNLNVDVNRVISVCVHELGHSLFDFLDMDHGGSWYYDHYSLGNFCTMSQSIGFGGRPSQYNPVFRIQNGWLAPTTLTTGTKSFTDLQSTGLAYSYNLPSRSGAVSNEKFYFTYHTGTNNYWEESWPIPSSQNIKKGVMIWRDSPTGYYSNKYLMPVDIETAHGKWDWDLSHAFMNPVSNPNAYATNLGTQNSATGLDSLEVRYSYIRFNWNSAEQRWVAQGAYPDFRIGSASCFFNPYNSKSFSFYSNPNSNGAYNSFDANYSRTISSEIRMSNLNVQNGSVVADFILGSTANVVSENATLPKGKWYFYNNVTVNSGVTLTIQPGAELYFSTNANLIVNGTLNAVGNSSNNITFTRSGSSGSWGGINFQYYGTGTLRYCNISYATTGVQLSVNGEVSYCNISNNSSSGIFLPMSSAQILNNQIRNNGYYGIYGINETVANIKGNIITGNSSAGIYYDLYSTLGVNSGPGSNAVRNNGRGISFNNYSEAFWGTNGVGGSNSISGNTNQEVYATSNSNVIVQGNWWGANPPNSSEFYADGTSTIDYSSYLSSDPNPTMQKSSFLAEGISAQPGVEKIKDNDNVLKDVNIMKALGLFMNKEYTDAITIFSEEYQKSNSVIKKKYILTKLSQCYLLNGKEDFVDYLNKNIRTKLSKTDELYATTLELEYLSMLEKGQNEEVLNILSSMKNNYRNSKDIYQRTLYNLVFVYAKCLNNMEKAKEIMQELAVEAPESEMTLNARIMFLGEELNDINMVGKDTGYPIKEESGEIVFDNYPNPFNPTTKISFSLKESGKVSLKVYDVLGKEVANLVDGVYEAGKHTATFDGGNLASGIYFYRLTTPTATITKKMVLTK